MGSRYRRPVTAEQREQAAAAREAKLAELHTTLAEQVTALANGPQWRRWLEVAARFHAYSFNNTLLILAQRRTATRVAGYQLWQQLGRQVTKGEKGLMILAPVTRRLPALDTANPPVPEPTAAPPGDAGTEKDRETPRRVVGYRVVYVWDVEQTSGEPLPLPPRPRLLTGQAPPGLWDALAAQCAAAGFPVRRDLLHGPGGPNGYTDFLAREVLVRSDVDDAQAVKTLAHELGHVLLHDPKAFPTGQTAGCRGTAEVEAESVAYLVAADAGLDTSGYTFAYVAAWAAEAGAVDDVLRTTATRVLTTARQVLDATTGPAADPADDELLATAADAVHDRAVDGAERTATLRTTVLHPPAGAGEDHSRERLLAANAAAAAFFTARCPDAWAPAYLQARLAGAAPPAGAVGYAPAGWTALTDHLHGRGFTDAEILAAGLGAAARTGRVVDRFRDRLMLPIRDPDGIVGFVGRRNPTLDPATTTGGDRTPKYLNTPTTALYRKGEHLYGLAEHRSALQHGAVAVLVEGPLDALAVTAAGNGRLVGVAPLGTALTDDQARRLSAVLGAGSDRVIVAADGDDAGRRAAERAYSVLTERRLDPRGAVLPAGLDPAALLQRHGPTALAQTLAAAEPLGRQLITQALDGRSRQWAEDRVAAARTAARILVHAPADTWPREIILVSARTGLDPELLRTALVEAVNTTTRGDDALGRLLARDRRDDLDRGQNVPSTNPAARSFPTRTGTSPTRPLSAEDTDRVPAPATTSATTRTR